MNEAYPDLDKTVREYVLGKLSEQETNEFEEYFLGRPNIVSMIEIAQATHQGLLMSEQSELNDRSAHGNRRLRLSQLLSNVISVPVPAYVVAALLPVMMVAVEFFNIDQVGESRRFELVTFSSEITRAGTSSINVDLTSIDSDFGFLVKVKAVDYPAYRLRLTAFDTEETLWESEEFQMSSLRDKLIVLPKSVAVGKQILTLYGLTDSGQEVEVRFCNYSEPCET